MLVPVRVAVALPGTMPVTVTTAEPVGPVAETLALDVLTVGFEGALPPCRFAGWYWIVKVLSPALVTFVRVMPLPEQPETPTLELPCLVVQLTPDTLTDA